MRLSIVILNWNGANFLRKFLPGVVRHSAMDGVEVVVADNGSTDNSLDVLRDAFPQVRVIELGRNYGFAEGYNRALEQIDADLFLLLNSDVEVTEGWLQPLIDCMDSHNDVAACQPKILSYAHRSRFEYAGAAGGFIDCLGYPFCRGRVLDTLEEDRGQYDTMTDIFWASGACLMLRARDFREAGGLDAGFFAHMEEIDLCWRLRSRKRRVVCVPQSVVHHVGGGTLGAENPQKTYLNYRNNLLMLYKNMPDDRLRKVMFARYFLDYLSALHMLLTARFRCAVMVFKARRHYKRLRPDYLPKRKENMRRAEVSTIREMLPRPLLLSYYLRRQKTYSSLTATDK